MSPGRSIPSLSSSLNFSSLAIISEKDNRSHEYCITGIFPGTFISRKMMVSTFSRFLISRPAHGCTDIKFTESV